VGFQLYRLIRLRVALCPEPRTCQKLVAPLGDLILSPTHHIDFTAIHFHRTKSLTYIAVLQCLNNHHSDIEVDTRNNITKEVLTQPPK
jgi:hypothetical protein